MWHVIVFLIFAIIAIVAAVNLVIQRHPITSALSLVGVMSSLAVMYLLLGAEFIAAAQMIVYAGAIMVLFVFVIMLLNTGAEPRRPGGSKVRYFGIPLLIAFLGLIVFMVGVISPAGYFGVAFGAWHAGPAEVGRALFTSYLLPFEVISILVLIAIVGAMVLARKEID